MMATWRGMNSVWKNKTKSSISQHFVEDDREIYDQNEIVNGSLPVNKFNQYFVNVGPSLAVKKKQKLTIK